jgi:glycosyltransferase involved in cell wall biosynthesis
MELALARVAGALAAEGMRHTVVAIKGRRTAAIEPAGVEVHYMQAGDGDLLLPCRLWRLIRRLRPNVIHAHNWGAWPDIALARMASLRPAPLIFSFHGLPDGGQMPGRRRLAFRILARVTTRLFAVSEGSRRLLVEHVGLPACRVDVINNGVDTERFAPAPGGSRAPGGRTIVGTVGSLTPVKNQSVLVRACGQLARCGMDLELRIAGAGPLAGELFRLAEARGLIGRLVLAGHVQDVPAFLRGLDIFALPSRTEAHPNALLEAMACALPCVAGNVHGVPEVLDHGRLGVLVDPDDASALAGAIATLAGGAETRRKLGQAARQHVCLRYGMDRMIAEYAKLYASVAAGRNRVSAAPRAAVGRGA